MHGRQRAGADIRFCNLRGYMPPRRYLQSALLALAVVGVVAFGEGVDRAAIEDPAGASVAFLSPMISRDTPGHSMAVDVDIRDGSDLVLVVMAANGNTACDHADWMEPRLVGPEGEIRLTDLPWRIVNNGWRSAVLNKSVAGTPMVVDGQPVPYGIGAHSPSIIVYDVPDGYRRFIARVGLDDSGTTQATGPERATVQFAVLTAMPSRQQLQAMGLLSSFNYVHESDLHDRDGATVAFVSDWISKATPGHRTDVDVPIADETTLVLAVTSGGNAHSDHANWIMPTLTGPAGEKRLTDLEWTVASCGWRSTVRNKSVKGTPMSVMGTEIENGIGTHAVSVTMVTVPRGYNRFRSGIALDDSGTTQHELMERSTVQFVVLTGTPSRKQIRRLGARGSYLRCRVDAMPEDGSALSVMARIKLHRAPWNTKPFALTPQPVEQPGYTEWVDLSGMPGKAKGPLVMSIPAGARGATQFAVIPHASGIVRDIGWDEPNGRQVIVDPGFTDVRTFRDQERRYYMHVAGLTPDTLFPLTRPPLLFANAWGWTTGGAAEYMVKSFRLMGLNCVATSDDAETYERLYGWGSQGGHYAPPRFLPYNEAVARDRYDAHYQAYFSTGDGRDLSPGMRSFQLADEPGEITVSGEEARQGFHRWLAARDLDPDFFGKRDWDEVSLLLKGPTGIDQERLFYWSRRYQGMITPRMFALASEAVRRHAPGDAVMPFVALSGHALYFGNKLSLDMFELAAYPDLMPGISDWMSTGGSWWWDSHQSVAFSVAPYNAGARRYGKDAAKDPVVFPMMHCVWPSLFRAYTQIANQCKLISYYNYGPDYEVTEGFWSNSGGSRAAVHRINNQAAQVDDILGPGLMRPTRVAMLYSRSSEYRRPQHSFRDKRATFLALSHDYYQPLLVTEEQIAEGALEHYDALFILDAWITETAQDTIEQWVRRGGLLWACADAGTRNEYGQGYDLLDRLAGIQRDFSDVKAADALRISPNDGADFEPHAVPGQGRPAVITWPGATIRATYGDGMPAWAEKTLGKGRVVYVGHKAGLAYAGRAERQKAKALWPDDGRQLITQPLMDAGIERDMILSEPLVMAIPLSTDAGTVIPLYDLSLGGRQALTLRLREQAKPVSVQWFDDTLSLVDLPFEHHGEWTTITLPTVPWQGNMVVVRRVAAPPDPRLNRMRQEADAALAADDWQALSAGAWFAGFFPGWDLADRLVALLQHEHWAVRRSAAESLGRLRYAAAGQALRVAVDTEGDDHALVDQIRALAIMGHQDAAALVSQLEESDNAFLREAGRRARTLLTSR